MNENLNDNFELLTESIIGKAESYEFKLNQLPEINDFKTDIRKDSNFNKLFDKLNQKEKNCLYWFELDSNEEASQLNVLLDSSRKTLGEKKRVVPVKNNNLNSNVIYLGIRRGGKRRYDNLTNISGRIIQHLGFYDKGSTQGLQLAHWANELDFKIKIKVVEFVNLPNEFLNVVEKLVAYKLKPLCGKH